MSAPVISLVGDDTPKTGRDKFNASLTSLRDNTVWLDPMSPQSGIASITGALLSSYLSVGASPAAVGAVRLENTAEIRWAYSGADAWRMRNSGNAWDVSFYSGAAWHAAINIVAGIVTFPTYVTFLGNVTIAEVASPSSPGSGYGTVYAKNDGKLYYKNSAGVEYDLTAGAGTSMYSRGAGLPSTAGLADGFIRYDETGKTLNININGSWVQI